MISQEEIGYLGPGAAYDALDNYGRHYGRLPLLLLLHAAVPQSFRPDLLNLIKVNFVPEAGDDLTVDADVLLSPLVKSTGAGLHRLDPEVRRQCLVLLDAAHKHSAERRSVAVARFLLAYVDEMIRRPRTAEDPLLAEYLRVEGWVAGAFVNPHEIAGHFARALEPIALGQHAAVRLHLGGLASALSVPLTGYPELIAYARALDAINTGNETEAELLIRRLGSEALEVGGVTLRAPAELLRERWIADQTPALEEVVKARSELLREETPEPAQAKERQIFISYRHLDDYPPPDGPSHTGFVSYLMRNVRYELAQLGVPDVILWQDRSKLAPADAWNENISTAINNADFFIIILTRNYISSSRCQQELSMITSRAKVLGKRRIFPVYKTRLSENEIPDPLRGIKSVRFYREDHDAVHEYFWRGKVLLIDEYEEAVRKLAAGISDRLDELGVPTQLRTQLSEPEPGVDVVLRSNGRVVFVAKPAGDMIEFYRTLVKELRGAGYNIRPDPDKDLFGEEVRSVVAEALAELEASIHLLGARTGGRPDGLDMDLVPMQLAAAADEAERRPGFARMIWAPAVLPGRAAELETIRRDPLEILEQFGQQLLQTDQIVGDTASRFNEFVLQRLERIGHRMT